MPMKAIDEVCTVKQIEKILKWHNDEDEAIHRSIESYERLLEKLKSRKETLNKTPKKKLGKKELKELKEELAIISLQIKKGEKIWDELNVKSLEISKN